MIGLWARGLVQHRFGRLVAAAFGIAVAVALVASLGSFLTSSQATMTQRASAGVAVDWQVAVQHGSSGGTTRQVLAAARRTPGTVTALPVGFADTSALKATTAGTTQKTGSGKVLGLPSNYRATFPQSIRVLVGSMRGAVVAQQTAANLHVAPGDTITVSRAGMKPFRVKVTGVVELPQADSLFQKVGAPPQSQLVAPPDNVVLLARAIFSHHYAALAKARPDLVTTQVHVRRSHALPPSPASAYVAESGGARNFEAATAGAGLVGDNLGAVLDAAREDAAYSNVLFLFLGAPGAVLAAMLTAAVAQAGAARRRREQDLLRTRGASRSQLLRVVLVEAGLISLLGGAVGLASAYLLGRFAFGTSGFGATAGQSALWGIGSLLLGVAIAALVIVVPARRDLTGQASRSGSSRPRWLSYGLDLVLIAVALGVFWAAGRNKYTLVLAPEGVPTLSVSYWAFLAPGLAWLGAGLLGWRLADLLLGPGRRLIALLLRPLAGNLAPTVAAMMSRQRRAIAGSAVLVGLALSFAMSTATFDSTYRHQAEIDAQLTNGADVTLTMSPGANTAPPYATKLRAVAGVLAVEPLQHRFAYVGNDLQDLYGINPSTILRATTLQDPYFQGGTAADMLHRLTTRTDGVLVSAETVNDYQLNLGDQLRLRLQDASTQRYRMVTFHYVGIVNEFPTAPKDSFIVANSSYVAQQTGSSTVGSFLVDTGGNQIEQVSSSVSHLVGTTGTVTTLNDARGLVGSSLTSVDLNGLTRLELAFALVIASAAGGLMTALGLTERRRSIAVATAIGATRHQLRRLSIGEPLFVGVIGIAIGGLSGWGLSYLLVKVLAGVFDPPPTVLSVPWTYLGAVVASVVVTLAAATAVVAARTRAGARELLRET